MLVRASVGKQNDDDRRSAVHKGQDSTTYEQIACLGRQTDNGRRN